jgi:hypothetical protein
MLCRDPPSVHCGAAAKVASFKLVLLEEGLGVALGTQDKEEHGEKEVGESGCKVCVVRIRWLPNQGL